MERNTLAMLVVTAACRVPWHFHREDVPQIGQPAPWPRVRAISNRYRAITAAKNERRNTVSVVRSPRPINLGQRAINRARGTRNTEPAWYLVDPRSPTYEPILSFPLCAMLYMVASIMVAEVKRTPLPPPPFPSRYRTSFHFPFHSSTGRRLRFCIPKDITTATRGRLLFPCSRFFFSPFFFASPSSSSSSSSSPCFCLSFLPLLLPVLGLCRR